MSNMDLFLPIAPLEFEKTASATMDEDPSTWTRQILAELHKSCPSIAEYSATVTFLKKDDQQGYALGMVVIENGVDSALAATRVGGAKPGRAVVPIIISNYELMPFDVFMAADGRALPLTPERLREALFNPAIGEALTTDFGDTSLYNLFYPLGRAWGADYGGGIGSGLGNTSTVAYGPGMKYASDQTTPLLEVIAPTLLGTDIKTMITALSDESIKQAAQENQNLRDAIGVIAEHADNALSSSEPLYKAASELASADVAQFGFEPEAGTYWMKTASQTAYVPAVIRQLDRGQMLKIAGDKLTHKVDTEGTVTVSKSRGNKTVIELNNDDWKPITEPGIYRVRTVEGTDLVGWAIPNLLSLDGTVMPVTVFSNGAVSQMQDCIMGARMATGADLPSTAPSGVGVFYARGQDGNVVATIPLRVEGAAKSKTGTAWLVTDMTGEKSKLHIVPGLRAIEVLGSEFFLPDAGGFIKLDDQPAVGLVADEGVAEKVAEDPTASSVVVRSSGADYRFSFENAPKLASTVRGELDHDQAMFALALGGLDAKTASDLLAQADVDGFSRAGVNDITTFSELAKEAREKTASLAAAIRGMKVSMVKEAAAMPSAMTVDAVLSLGFLNPENVRLFVGRLPYLEKVLSMVCEMVVASRLGLTAIPEGAASRAARALDGVINGLRGLALLDMDQA